MTRENGAHIGSRHMPAYCEKCGRVTEHVRNEFEYAIYYVCQTCAVATVAKKRRVVKSEE
jgi:ribosome-binding protein aMBF1 (putative translation factor)